MRWFISIGLLFVAFLSNSQVKPDLYLNPASNTSTHSNIAILPFYCLGDPSDFKNAPNYQIFQEQQLGLNLQSILYYKMISFNDRFTVAIQDVNQTNHLLREAGISSYRFPDIKTVASLLNVDAVIFCVITHDSKQYLEDNSLIQLLERQHVPGKSKLKDMFLSLFSADETCIMTYSTNSEIIRSLKYYEVMPHMYLFTAMQYLPYWKGDKIKLI